MSWLLRRPIFFPIRSRLMVTGLSAITCDVTRNPFSGLGSMVTRKSGASANSEVSWQTTTEAWLSGKAIRNPSSDGARSGVGNDQAQLAQTPCAPALPHHLHPFGWCGH